MQLSRGCSAVHASTGHREEIKGEGGVDATECAACERVKGGWRWADKRPISSPSVPPPLWFFCLLLFKMSQTGDDGPRPVQSTCPLPSELCESSAADREVWEQQHRRGALSHWAQFMLHWEARQQTYTRIQSKKGGGAEMAPCPDCKTEWGVWREVGCWSGEAVCGCGGWLCTPVCVQDVQI